MNADQVAIDAAANTVLVSDDASLYSNPNPHRASAGEALLVAAIVLAFLAVTLGTRSPRRSPR